VGVRPGSRTKNASHDRGPRTTATRRLRRTVRAAVPLVQLTAAATAAWVIALQFGGHDEPFFAPMAVVVALSSPLGERGSNAVRLLAGVMIGIAAGELTVLTLGGGYGRLALATFAAMALARVIGGPRLVMVQAAAGAILTVAAADGEAGVHRLIDAAIGAGVALVFSQVLLSPEPVALVRRAAVDALARMAEALTFAAQALERRDDNLANNAMNLLRDQHDSLGELARLRKASGRVARHSAIWRSRIEPAVRENENAGHLDLLGASCLLLVRAVAADPVATSDRVACATLAPSIQRLADALKEMAADPGDQVTRQAAADHALAVAQSLSDAYPSEDPAFAAAVLAVQMVSVDVLVVAGVDPDEAAGAVRRGTDEFRVPAPPRTPRLPFASERRPRRPS
jgi:Fusaric acid resistance protein-like